MSVIRKGGHAFALCAAWLAACKDAFPNAPAIPLSIDAASWYDTVMVSDVDTLQISVRRAGGGDITGIQVHWESSNPAKLEVTPLPLIVGREQDSLKLQLQTVITAHARDSAVTISAIVDRPGFERDTFSRQVTVMERWIAISAGRAHTCALNLARNLFCWGFGGTGALGDGSSAGSVVPVEVIGVGGLTFRSVSAGDDDTCGDVLQGLLNCWGSGTDGRLGNGAEFDQFTPVDVSSGHLFQLSSAGATSCGLSDAYVAFCWGNNRFGQLGAPKSPFFPFDKCFSGVDCSLRPRAVRSGSDTLTFWAVDVGRVHVCGIAKWSGSRAAYCWGLVLDSISLQYDTAYTPVPVAGGLPFATISAGGQHTCGVSPGGTTYCWGVDSSGQLGIGPPATKARPTAVLTSLKLSSISAGNAHTCGLALDATAYCWGANDYGQLGIDSTGNTLVPRAVAESLTFVSISAGDFHTCGITSGGVAYCWGRNDDNQLGRAVSTTCTVSSFTYSCSRRPVRVSEPRSTPSFSAKAKR